MNYIIHITIEKEVRSGWVDMEYYSCHKLLLGILVTKQLTFNL